MDNDDIMLNIARPTQHKDTGNEEKKGENRKLKYSVKFRKENARRGRREK